MMAKVNAPCRAADHARLRPQLSCSKNISPLAMGLERLRNDTDVRNSGTLHRVHDGCKGPERNVFVRAQKNGLMLWVAHFLPQLSANLIDVYRIVAQKDALLFVDADHQPFFGDFFDSPRFRNGDFNSGLKHRSRDHKNNQQHQHYVHQRSDVDVRKRDLRAPICCRECHYLRTSSGIREAVGCRSTAFSISSEKSSLRAAKSRMEPPIRL